VNGIKYLGTLVWKTWIYHRTEAQKQGTDEEEEMVQGVSVKPREILPGGKLR